MSSPDRDEAIRILKHARDTLSERLVQRILDSKQEILDDAEGHSFLSEIETIYDELGGRLAHVGTMLSHLPPAAETATAEAGPSAGPVFTGFASYEAPPGTATSASFGPLALPAPAVAATELPRLPAPLTLETFVAQVHLADFAAAAHVLAELFEIELARARRCTEAFCANLMQQSATIAKMDLLRSELQGGSVNGALMLLWECFGLRGIEALAVFQTLRTRLIGSAPSIG